MNPSPETPPEKDPRLSKLLQTWQLESSLPPDFHNRVLRRIEGIRTAASYPAWVRAALRWLTQVRRPAVAVAYVVTLMVLGAASGFWHSRPEKTADSASRLAYVALIDPYQMTPPKP